LLLPIGDEPNPHGVPWVNYALLTINIGVFVVVTLPLMLRPADPSDPLTQAYLRALIDANPQGDPREIAYHFLRGRTAYDMLLLQWGYRPGAPSVLTLLTSMFLHGGWAHLLGNMLFLWIYGDNVEHALGRPGYLTAYLLTGAIAALSYGVLVPAADGQIPMVGASGAISGVLGFYFIWFPRNRVRLVLFPLLFLVWKVQARLVLGFFVIVDNLLPFLLRGQGGSGVAHGAHIGGFVAGVTGALVLNRWHRHRCRQSALACGDEETGESLPRPVPGAGAEEVIRQIDAARPARAIRAYLALSTLDRQRVPVEVVAQLADWLASSGQPDAALALYRQAQDDHPRGPGLDRLFLGIGLVLLHGKGRPTAAYQYLLDALDASPSTQVAAAAREALASIDRMQKLRMEPRDHK